MQKQEAKQKDAEKVGDWQSEKQSGEPGCGWVSRGVSPRVGDLEGWWVAQALYDILHLNTIH